MPIIIDPPSGLPVPRRTDKAPRSKRRGRVPGPADVAQIDAQVLRDPGVHATPDDFGAGIGKAIERFGAAAGRVASDFATMRRAAEDDTAGIAGLADARVRFTTVAQSMEAQATGAEGFTDTLGAALTDETEAILRDLRQVRGLRPSKQGEAAIRRQLGLLASRMVARGAMFEQRARLSQLGHAVDFSVGDFAMAAFNRPADFPAIIEEMEASLERFENKLPPGILAAKVAAARTTIGESAVAGLIEKDPATALAALEGGTFDRVLAPPGKALVLKQARAAVAVGEKATTAEVAAAIEDHLVSLQTTGAGLGGITERARAALDGKAFKAFERDEKDARAFHETMESVKFARPEVIERELETRRPRKGARNFAENQRHFRVLERGAKQMLNVRARDGATFVMEIGGMRAAFERAGDDGPDLRRALKFRMAIQSKIGIPEDRVRLLTRAEAGALASELQSAAVEDRAAGVAGLQDRYGPLFGRAMTELSEAGLDPRFQALAAARDNPALARTIAKALERGGAGPEQALDPAGSQEVRGRLRDLTADARPDADPGGEIADAIDAIRSAAEALGVEYLRETGRVEESAARAAAFANGAIEEALLTAADTGEDGGVVTGGGGNNTLAGGAEERLPSGADKQEEVAELPVENKALMKEIKKKIEDRKKVQKEIKEIKDNSNKIAKLTMEESRIWAILNDKRNVWFNIKDNPKETGEAPFGRQRKRGVKAVRDHDAVIEREARAQGVDPDLVRAIMYYENADGNLFGLGKGAERADKADTLLPMNINPKIWAGMGGVGEEEFKDPEKNIRAGVALIKGIWDRLRPEDRTAAKIGSIYNFTGRENVSGRGARIGHVFDERSWEK